MRRTTQLEGKQESQAHMSVYAHIHVQTDNVQNNMSWRWKGILDVRTEHNLQTCQEEESLTNLKCLEMAKEGVHVGVAACCTSIQRRREGDVKEA